PNKSVLILFAFLIMNCPLKRFYISSYMIGGSDATREPAPLPLSLPFRGLKLTIQIAQLACVPDRQIDGTI
ncbi:MAG: hypothetical protein AAF483_30795, partial [Planctomycetota bacterium]